MSNETRHPTTLMEAVTHFADPLVCHEYMKSIKWPDGRIVCPKCDSDNVGEIKTRCTFKCRVCKKQFSTKVGTIFEDSPLSLQKWFVAAWSIANAKNGISSCELARAIGVTQKTAWFMLHRLRLAMKTQSFQKIRGEVEGDECFVGGSMKNMHPRRKKAVRAKWNGKGIVGKTTVQGLLERKGPEGHSMVRAGVVKDNRGKTLVKIIRQNVEPSATMMTDDLKSYRALRDEYVHEMVNHAVAYVRGRVHTNGMENFWSLLQRTLSGTYVAVEPDHLNAYLDEQTMRFNSRKTDDAGRFKQVMGNVPGRRVTYCDLIA